MDGLWMDEYNGFVKKMEVLQNSNIISPATVMLRDMDLGILACG